MRRLGMADELHLAGVPLAPSNCKPSFQLLIIGFVMTDGIAQCDCAHPVAGYPEWT